MQAAAGDKPALAGTGGSPGRDRRLQRSYGAHRWLSAERRVLIRPLPLCSDRTLCCSDTVRAVTRPELLLLPVMALTRCALKNFEGVILRGQGLMGSGLVDNETFLQVEDCRKCHLA